MSAFREDLRLTPQARQLGWKPICSNFDSERQNPPELYKGLAPKHMLAFMTDTKLLWFNRNYEWICADRNGEQITNTRKYEALYLALIKESPKAKVRASARTSKG